MGQKKKKIIFIVEAEVEGKNDAWVTKNIRAVRKAVKIGVNSIDGVRATRISNKEK